MQNLVSLFGTLTEESDLLVNELQELTLESQASNLTDTVLHVVSEATSLECGFESKKIVHIALHKGFQDARIDKLAPALDMLAHKLLDASYHVHLTVMHIGLSEAVNGSLEDVIIYLGRSIEQISYAHGGCAHNAEVQTRLVKLISNAPALRSLNLEQCEAMTSKQLLACVISARCLETLILNQCTTLESSDVAVCLARSSRLHRASFAGCKSLQDSAFGGIAKLPNLRILDLSRCGITDVTIEKLKELRLEKLILQKCKSITVRSFEHIAQFSRPLLSLDITGTQTVLPEMLNALATRHMYAHIAADCSPFDQLSFHRKFPFVVLSKQEATIERAHEPLAVILQFLQKSFPDTTCEFFTNEDHQREVHIILSQVSQEIEVVPQSFLDYLKSQNVHLQIAYEILSSSTFCMLSHNFLGAFASVTVLGTGLSKPLDIVGCKSITSLSFINCPLRDTDLEKFASEELLHLKIQRVPHLTDRGFMRFPDLFPKLQSLDLRKCDNITYSAIASLALRFSAILESLHISKPKGPIGSLDHLAQEELIALLIKLAHAELKGVQEAIETTAELIEIKPLNFATLIFLATKYKISSLQNRLGIWLSRTFKDSLFLTVDVDRYSLTVMSAIDDSDQLEQLITGILSTKIQLLLTIWLTQEGVKLEVLTKIALQTKDCRDGIAVCNKTKNISHVKVLCERLFSDERELSFEDCELGSDAFKVIVSKCPNLTRFHSVQPTGVKIEDVAHLLQGCRSLVHFGLVHCKEKLPKLLETINREAPHIQELDLRGADVSALRQGMLPNLRKVNLACSTLQDAGLEALDQQELIEADFEGTQVTNAGMFKFLSQPRKLERLSLAGVPIDRLCLYKMPASMPNLRELYLAKCNVTEDALLMLTEGHKQLDIVDVMHCPSIHVSLAHNLLHSAERTVELHLSMEDKYSPECMEILMTHFRSLRSLMLTFCKEATYEQMSRMLCPPTVENIEKFSISGYIRPDILLLELLINRLKSLTHFVWTGPVSFGAFTTFAKAARLQKLKIICENAKAIVDVDAAINQLDSKSLKYLTLLGFAQFTPRGLEKLLEKLAHLKGITLSKSIVMTEEVIQHLRPHFKTKITLV